MTSPARPDKRKPESDEPKVGKTRTDAGSAEAMTAALVQGVVDRFLRKYLLNVSTEHATVWGGQLVFKNVELRLDVLQEERETADTSIACLRANSSKIFF